MDSATSEYRIDTIDTSVRGGLRLDWANLAILFCAIIIACVGLNMDSSPVVIGAMLISPLMDPIMGMGYSIGSGYTTLLRRSARLFGTQLAIGVVTATFYFSLSPIKVASEQLTNRTAPTLWDVLIAFFGGVAGIIGSAKKDSGNILPGVAIATALMPPLCTVGYGISQGNGTYLWGAAYLFLINSFFIALAAAVGTIIFRLQSGQKLQITLRSRMIAIGLAVLITIPSVISATMIVRKSVVDAQLDQFISSKLSDVYVTRKDVADKQITLSVIGSTLSKPRLTQLKRSLGEYHLGNYKLTVRQLTNGGYMTTEAFNKYLQEQSKAPAQSAAPTTTDSDLSDFQTKILAKYADQISDVYVGELTDTQSQTHRTVVVKLTATGRKHQFRLNRQLQALQKKSFPDLKATIVYH